jgi:hypothetical protein
MLLAQIEFEDKCVFAWNVIALGSMKPTRCSLDEEHVDVEEEKCNRSICNYTFLTVGLHLPWMIFRRSNMNQNGSEVQRIHFTALENKL